MDTNHGLTGESPTPNKLSDSLSKNTLLTGNRAYWAIVGLTFLAVAVAGGLWGALNILRETQHRTALRREGSEAVGEITRTQKRKTSDILYYAFTANRTSYTGEAELPGCLFDDLPGSNVIPIRYLPANPNVNHPAAWEWSVLYWPPENSNFVVLPEFSSELQWFFAPLIFGPISLVVLVGLRTKRKSTGGPGFPVK